MSRKKIVIITSAVLAFAIVVLSVSAIVFKTTADYSLLSKEKSEAPVYTDVKLSSENEITLGELNGKQLSYRRDLMAFYFSDAQQNVYTSGTAEGYYTLSGDLALDKNMYTVCQISYTDFEGSEDAFSSTAENCIIKEKALENGISLGMWFPDYEIGITVEVWLNEYGIKARIPVKSITEKGKYGITSITLFPLMGSVPDSDSGFILYPDGSGSLYKFGRSVSPSPISTSVYFENSFELDTVNENIRQAKYNVMLPAFGITDGNRGVVSYITGGESNSYVTLSPSGFSYDLNRVSASCMYRKSYSYISPSNVEITEVERKISAEDFAVQYFFIDKSGENSVSYSNMAVLVRDFMMNTGRIKTSKLISDNVEADLQIIMGTKSDSGMSTGYKVLTDFNNVKEIVNSVEEAYRNKLNLYMLGWQQFGYGLNPSGDKHNSRLGSSKDLIDLNEYLKKNNIDSFMVADYIYGQNKGKNFNKSSQAVYNEMNLPITNADYTEYLLNPLIELKKLIEKRIPYFTKNKVSGVALDKIGYFLYDDYRSDRALNREKAADAFEKMAENLKKNKLNTAIQGGNAFMLPSADAIYDLPESSSGNTEMAYSVPFYQMVIHGTIPYSGNISGNMSADYTKQKLKWIEYGSRPSFVLTYESSELLKNTYSDFAFATDFKEHIETINECLTEFNTKLKFTANEKIVDHKVISDELVKVSYEGGNSVIINYSKCDTVLENIKIPAEDYIVIKGADGR